MPSDSLPREGILSTTTFPGLMYSILPCYGRDALTAESSYSGLM